MKIFYTSKFRREYRKLSSKIKLLAEARESIFRQDPHSLVLKTHKLHGDLAGFWSFSVNVRYRIIFEFWDDGDAYLHSIGDHSVYE